MATGARPRGLIRPLGPADAPRWSASAGRCTDSYRVDRCARRRGRYTTAPPSYRSCIPWLTFDPRLIDDLARRLASAVPENVAAVGRDLEQNFKGVLQAQLARLDLVTREEFDVQSAVLKRTREKLTALEQRLDQLEGGKPA